MAAALVLGPVLGPVLGAALGSVSPLPLLMAAAPPQHDLSETPASHDTDQQVMEAAGDNVSAQLHRHGEAGSARSEFRDEEKRGEAARDFAYGWPAQVGEIPAFAALLAAMRDEALTHQRQDWEASIAEFGDGTDDEKGMGCFTCINRSYSANWQIAADTPRFLILSAEIYTYTGGAHGNYVFDAMLWDREAAPDAQMRPIGLFVNEVAVENAAYGDYCQALLEVRVERHDMNIEGLNKFENCPSVSELVVVPRSSDGVTFDRLEFLAAPYVAGSFAEGSYEFSVPVTAALIETVRPEYRGAFSIGEQAGE